VPAPQLASPALGLGFCAVAPLAGCFFGGVFEAVVAGAAVVAGGVVAAGGVSVAAGVAVGVSVVVEAALVVGDVAAAPDGEAPHPLAEHDALPVAGAAVAGATSLALTGCGEPPPQATRALAPRAASTAAMFSNDRSDRMAFSVSVADFYV
jgi:hypothetical protein